MASSISPFIPDSDSLAMAQQPHPQREFPYKNVEIFRNEENTLGIGSYGAVYRAKCDELPCAAKCLHPVFFQFNDPSMLAAIGKFEQECHFLSTVRHPNIIQYLGMIRDPDSGRPVLLMELLDESLTRFLERQASPLPYHIQVHLAHDIALALSYLHSNRIIHRDLSSNNVLLIAGSRAKVTDFGMSKLVDTNPRMTPLTKCPGTVAYMSPESLREPPVYTEKLDCFSEGVLIIQIITQQFPNPGPPRRMIDDPRFEVGTIEVPIPETERRHSHIVLIDPAHPLLRIALRCLDYRQGNRPSARELCCHIAALKEAPEYTESVQQASPSERDTGGQSAAMEQGWEVTEQLQRENRDLREQILQQSQQLQEKELQQKREKQTTIAANERLQQQLQSQRDQLRASNAISQRKIQQLRQELQQQVQEKDYAIKARERQLRELNEQLQTDEQVAAELQQNLQQKERMVRDLEERLAAKDRELQQQQSSRRESIKLTWREGRKAPRTMHRGSAAVEGSMAYFRPSGTREVHAYDSENEEWSQLPECPHDRFCLAVVKGLVTTIGGSDSFWSDTLLSLTGQGRDRKWTEHFPPMPTKRCLTTTAYTERKLIVAGGYTTGLMSVSTCVVEVMDTEKLEWYTATSLPYPLSEATATVCGDRIYMLGGNNKKSVLTCSLTALFQSCESLGEQLLRTLTLQDKPSVWHTVADIPVYYSSCVTLKGELVAVGGCESDYTKKTTAVYQYSPSTNSWHVITHMKIARDLCLVAVLPNNKLVVAGGRTGTIGSETDATEIATVL